VYHKPTKAEGGYHPKRSNANQWYFRDLSTNICAQIEKIGMEYYEKRKKGGIKGHFNKNFVTLTKAFWFEYLTSGRLMETFLEPYPVIKILPIENKECVVITKVNEKHKTSSGGRLTNDIVMPILCEHEAYMWMFITDGGKTLRAQSLFKYEIWKSLKKSALSQLVKRNFRTDLVDKDNNVHIRAGITPHILRHMRPYNWKFQHGVPDDLIVKWAGWKDTKMFYEYVHIRSMLNMEKQLDMLKHNNLILDHKITIPEY
jgi:hypothetical protein